MLTTEETDTIKRILSNNSYGVISVTDCKTNIKTVCSWGKSSIFSKGNDLCVLMFHNKHKISTIDLEVRIQGKIYLENDLISLEHDISKLEDFIATLDMAKIQVNFIQ